MSSCNGGSQESNIRGLVDDCHGDGLSGFSRDNFPPRSLPSLPRKMSKTATKPESNERTKKTKSAVGAPSQLSQGTRNGKKAWRKHIDIDKVEEGLEMIRSEERVMGTALHNQPDKELFTVDVTGDEGGETLTTCARALSDDQD